MLDPLSCPGLFRARHTSFLYTAFETMAHVKGARGSNAQAFTQQAAHEDRAARLKVGVPLHGIFAE